MTPCGRWDWPCLACGLHISLFSLADLEKVKHRCVHEYISLPSRAVTAGPRGDAWSQGLSDAATSIHCLCYPPPPPFKDSTSGTRSMWRFLRLQPKQEEGLQLPVSFGASAWSQHRFLLSHFYLFIVPCDLSSTLTPLSLCPFL